MRQLRKQNPRTPHHAIGHHRGALSRAHPNVRPKPRATQRAERRGGGLTVKVGIETIPIAYLCPSKLAIAVHRYLLRLMELHPETFPELSMCVRTQRADMTLAISYGTERHIVQLEEARDYLERLVGGYTGRHDEPKKD